MTTMLAKHLLYVITSIIVNDLSIKVCNYLYILDKPSLMT